jgi:transcriptional regulator with XRE-family HTH domain
MGNRFPERLKETRQAHGLTQELLAEKVGIGKNQVWQYETGKVEPRMSTLIWLAETLGVSIDWLVGKENDG